MSKEREVISKILNKLKQFYARFYTIAFFFSKEIIDERMTPKVSKNVDKGLVFCENETRQKVLNVNVIRQNAQMV